MTIGQISSRVSTPPKTKLLDQVRETIRRKHYGIRTETTYIDWIKRYILFHRKRHPAEMGGHEMEQFLNHLAVDKEVAARSGPSRWAQLANGQFTLWRRVALDGMCSAASQGSSKRTVPNYRHTSY
jgi:hypothetical protein